MLLPLGSAGVWGKPALLPLLLLKALGFVPCSAAPKIVPVEGDRNADKKIREFLGLEKPSRVTESSCSTSTAQCPQVPHPQGFQIPPGIGIPFP